ncbi:MAG: DUF4177 domain-containing protein [Victivallales bacterium]|nr:DUF4177 domain-containing protein [Victivallales bacterium]
MQYKTLNFEIVAEQIGFFGGKTISKEEKLKQMDEKLNELAKDGWRVHQMSTNALTSVTEHGGGCYGYNVLVIMEKE